MVYWVLLATLVQAQDLPDLGGPPPLPGIPGNPPANANQVNDPTIRKVVIADTAQVEACARKVEALEKQAIDAANNPTVACPPPEKTKRSERKNQKRDLDIYDANNACLPLTSENPAGNPYHADLLGVDPNSVLTRDGYGRGFALDGEINTGNTGGAVWTLTRTISFSKSTMVGVSYSDGVTDTRVNGTSWGNATSSSFQQSLSNMFDTTTSRTNLDDKSQSFATDLQKSLTNAYEDSTSSTQTFDSRLALENAVTWNEANGNTRTVDLPGGFTDSATTGTHVTVGWDKSKDHTKSTEVSYERSVDCDFDTGETAENSLDVELQASVNGGYEKIDKKGKGKTYKLGLQGSVTTTGSVTKHDKSTITVTFTVAVTDNDALTEACTVSGDIKTFNTKDTGSHHNSNEGTSNNSNKGGSYSGTKANSESNSKTKTASDSVSDAITRGSTSSKGWNNAMSDVYGGSTSKGITNITDIGVSFNLNNQMSVSTDRTISKGNSTETTDTTSWVISKGLQINLDSDECLIPVCSPSIRSTVVSHICVPPNVFDSEGNPVREIVVTEWQKRKPKPNQSNNGFGLELFDMDCNIRWIKCSEGVSYNEPVFSPGPGYNYIEEQGIHSDVSFSSGLSTVPNAKGYYFGWSLENEFQVLNVGPSGKPSTGDNAVWWSGVKLPDANNIHLKITDDGHINIYADNVYAYTDGSASVKELVWSSLPYHMDYAVGTYGNRNGHSNFGYRLTISQNGIPELYDSVYVKVWSGDKNFWKGNIHSYGYKFPTTVQYPFRSPPALKDRDIYCNYKSTASYEKSQIDLHNDKPAKIKWIGFELAYHTILNENEGIKSPDERFTLHLSATGNLILKEGCRTMWETSTAKRWFGQSPFKALISSDGNLFIKDFKNRAIWSSLTTKDTLIRKIIITETGNIVGLDSDGLMGWQSRQDELMISNSWNIWQTPQVIFDDESERQPVNVTNIPLVNLYNSRCLALNPDGSLTTGLAQVDVVSGLANFTQCQMWNYNPLLLTYSPAQTFETCLGPKGIQPCNEFSLWRHYDDGLMVNVETAQCLNGTAALIPCTKTNLRVDKLWSHGFKGVTSISTNGTNLFLQGQMYYQNKMGFRFYPDKQRKLIFQVFDYNRPKIKIYQYSWNTNLDAKDGTYLRLLSNGLSANSTALNNLDGRPTQAGILPFRLDLNDKTLSVLDANNKPIWYWNFRK